MASNQYIYVMHDLTKVYPGHREIVRDVTLAFLPGAKIGVLGYNGAGKSTLLRIMAGIDTEFSGEARAAEGTRVGYLHQEPELDPDKDVMGNVLDGVGEVRDLLERFEAVSARFAEEMSDDEMNDLLAEQGDLQELCRLLLSRPDLLLLDEPTNHLDAESVAWLEHFLADYEGTVVAVTHDRYFLDNVAGWILELDRGRALPFEGNYSAWLEAKENRVGQEERESAARARVIARELEWIRATPEARRTKSQARINAYEQLVSEAETRAPGTAQIIIPPGPRLGNVVVEAEGLTKGFGDRLLIENLDFRLPAGGIVGVIGPNGAGKSTLMHMITGADTPDSGTLRLGETVKLGYVDQSRDALKADATVWEEISGGEDEVALGKRTMPSRAYVGAFNFRGPDQQKKVGQLSGGERNRVHLAKMLKSGANLLLLDEPTNDLDVDTLRALEEALAEFAGSAVVVSHDRWFLDRIATHILAFEGDSHVEWFQGNYADYEADRKRRLGADAEQPHRIKYKPLSRD
jgi:ATP-binding cassette ChvD family protein